MTNECWQSISQIAIAIGLGLTAVGGFGAYVFSQRIEREKSARGAYAGKIEPKRGVIFSVADQIIPKIEFGDSGAILAYGGPQGSPFITFAQDTQLTIVTEDNQVKVSTIVRDKNGTVVAELRKNEWKINPNNSWDRNYTADALEVKDRKSVV